MGLLYCTVIISCFFSFIVFVTEGSEGSHLVTDMFVQLIPCQYYINLVITLIVSLKTVFKLIIHILFILEVPRELVVNERLTQMKKGTVMTH